MRAMVLPADSGPGPQRLRPQELPTPEPQDGEVLLRVERCGVCRTDLHIVDGDLPRLHRAVIPGHEVVGTITKVGPGVRTLTVGQRVGVPWLRSTCGRCEFCVTGRENLCAEKRFTGYTEDGGYAEYVTGVEGYVFPLPSGDPDRLAPFLCAGIIGYRALKLAAPRPGGRIGFFGFGASAHLALQVAARLGFETVAYSRSPQHLDLARRLGASETVLTGGPDDPSRTPTLDAGIVFAPAGPVVLAALAELKKGATLSIPAIHLSPIPAIDYDRLLFGERRLVSVESNTREDAREFLELAGRLGLESAVSVRPLAEANEALDELRAGRVVGAVVLDCRSA
jgi:alcohol dehydrogenase, propanol-preferring